MSKKFASQNEDFYSLIDRHKVQEQKVPRSGFISKSFLIFTKLTISNIPEKI